MMRCEGVAAAFVAPSLTVTSDMAQMLSASHRGGVVRKEVVVDEENDEIDKQITRIEKK